MNPYFIRTIVRENGERLPLLCHRDSGTPLFYPTCYALSELRNSGLASKTMEQSLRSVMVLHLVLTSSKIDIFERLNAGQLLEQWEVDDTMRQVQIPLRRLAANNVVGNVIDLDAVRAEKASGTSSSDLNRRSRSVRFVYIRGYLAWLADLWTGRLRQAGKPDLARQLEGEKKRVSAQFASKIHRRRKRATLKEREGLSKAEKARLLDVIALDSTDNPWGTEHTRIRNALAVSLLIKLGCRRGELLGLRTKDFDFATGLVKIVRKADDKEDPRPHQPGTKTNDREVSLGDDLTQLVRQYVQGPRRAIKGARKHGFLFVSNGTGAPLSLDGLAKVFKALRDGCPDLPQDLSPHVLRHTWNEDFSEHCDRENISSEEEVQLRNYVMGWAPDSDTSRVYLRRRTREESQKASLKMQGDLVNKAKK